MRNKILVGILIASMILLSSFVLAHDYLGWEEIRPALKDGDGAEFVVDTIYNVEFPGLDHFRSAV
jgi:hypothetical protein